MTPPGLLVANVGAEEEDAPGDAARALADRVGLLWRTLFAPPAFDWLPGSERAVAWLNTEPARREASECGLELFGASPAVVRRVHDKAFAHGVALREGLVPPVLRDAIAVLEPEDLTGDRLAEVVAHLPAWARARFTLKPRFGGSGRGRVAGSDGRTDTPALRGALERLATRGGALLEPWLPRSEDLSAQLFVAPDGALRLLGTTRQVLTPAGLYRGQRGWVDHRGRIVSGSDDDETLRTAAASVALAAHEEGFSGPCGVDAFHFRAPGGETTLRPVVELNARFTVGTVVLGLVRRRLDELRTRLALTPGERRAFLFLLDTEPPPAGEDLLFIPLPPRTPEEPDGRGRGAGLFFARDPARLDAALPQDAPRQGALGGES